MDERIEELIALAAVGELTPDEASELDAAASRDPEVAAELAAELETAAALLSASPMAAPTSMRDSVLEAIAGTPQDAELPAATPERSQAAGTVSSLTAARERRERRLAPRLLAAAAAVAVVAGGSVFVLSDRDPSTDPIEAVAESSDAVERVFDGDLGGSLVLVYSADENAVVLDGERLPVLDEATAYVLWTIRDDAVTAVGEFRPDDDGTVRVRIDGVDPTDASLGITEEPIGTYEVPTLPIRATA